MRERAIILFLAYTFPSWKVGIELLVISGWVTILVMVPHNG
jgi:hypothetical protein